MVLPERIELSTSPLPRECSTTELRQLGYARAEARDTRRPRAWQGERSGRFGIDCSWRLTAARRSLSIAGVTDKPNLTHTKASEHAARDERLARALRDNLRRRKEQARARAPNSGDRPGKATDADEPPA